MLSIIGLIIVVVVGLILFMASRKPDAFRVERGARINAPPERIFPLLNNFHNWARWSPWEKIDPAMSRDYGGPESGVGSFYAWLGNSKAGQGRMEITESTPPSHIRLNLDFLKPFKASNVTEFDLTPEGDSTELKWSMYGPSTFATKVMMIFTTMDKMVGKDFEQGLANLKRAVEPAD